MKKIITLWTLYRTRLYSYNVILYNITKKNYITNEYQDICYKTERKSRNKFHYMQIITLQVSLQLHHSFYRYIFNNLFQ